MNCKKCGHQLIGGEKFCRNCGSLIEQVVINEPQINQNREVVNPNTNVNNQPFVPNQPSNQVNPTQQEFALPQQNSGVFVPNQPTYNQPQPQQTFNTPQNGYNPNVKSGGNKNILIAIGALVLVAAAVIIFLVVKGLNNNKPVVELKDEVGYKVNFKGFSFEIPTNLVYEVNADELAINNQSGTWFAYIEVMNGINYSQISSNKNMMKSGFENIGFTTKNMVEKKYSGTNFITLEATKDGTNYILGVTNANSMNLFGITFLNEDNDYDYSTVNIIAPILSKAKFAGESNNIKLEKEISIKNVLSPELFQTE